MKSVFLFTLAAVQIATAANAGRVEPEDSLKISRNVALEEVVVTATKVSPATPIAYSNLSKAELERRNDGQGIPSLMSTLPSVIVTSDAGSGIGYSGFRIRGTDDNRINITVNGVPVNDSESHSVFWVNMPDFASSVENIQVQRGAGTSTNGAASFGATVALQTQPPAMKPSAEYSVSTGSFNTVKHTVKGSSGMLNNHFTIDARYSDVRSDGYIDRAKANMSSYYLSTAWYGDNTLIKFQTFGSAERTYQAWNGVPDSLLKKGIRTYNPCGQYTDGGVVKFYDNQTDNYWQQHYHLTGSQYLNDSWNMNLTLHYTHGYGYYEDYKGNAKYSSYKLPPYTDPDGKAHTRTDLVRRKFLDNDFYGGIYSANYRSERLQLTAGVSVNNYAGNHFGHVIWAKAANALPDPDYEYYRNKGEKLDYSSFVKTNLQFFKSFNAYLDLQYRGINYTIKGSDDKAGENVDIAKNWNFFNPKAGINYNSNGNNAFISFSTANREPNRKNFTEAAPNERPTYETLYDYEGGYTYNNKSFYLGTNLYYMLYSNQLILTGKISEIGEALTSNIKKSYRAGIELSGGITIAPFLNWSGNISLSSNKIRDFVEYIENYDTGEQEANRLGSTNIAFSPSVTGNSIFDFSAKGFSASLISQYVGRQYLDNTSTLDRSLDPYFVNSLQVGYAFKPKFVKELSFDVTVNNLFNEKYETNGWVYSYISEGKRMKDSGYFVQAGTHFMCRLTVKL